MKRLYGLLGLVIMSLASCNNHSESNQSESSRPSSNSNPVYTNSGNTNQSYTSSDNSETTNSDDENDDTHKNEDGTQSATVDYYNPTTGYSSTYTLDVEVEDGQVKQINFPNGGYLDDDHITPADIDEDGNAHVEGEEGKTYDVHVDPE